MLNEAVMDMPPYWIGVRAVIADRDGLVPPYEREDIIDLHFCSEKCTSEYFDSDEFRARKCMIDKNEEEDLPDIDEGDVV